MDQLPPETEDLGWRSASPPRIALIEGVNDASAELVDAFRVTRYELEVLARNYLEEMNAIVYWCATTWGTTEDKSIDFVADRVNSIARVLGDDAFAEAVAAVQENGATAVADLKSARNAVTNSLLRWRRIRSPARDVSVRLDGGTRPPPT
jgi:hypothetical protein